MIGKVGSIITQGVYSVATPFHPFGGAVDVIVVQQQDGTFRSTPWYVRFGKFQGVLKGAEKFVRINVNGIDANFHMCLDNSGEAYFIKEVDPGKGGETSGSVKDSDNLTREDSDGQSTGNKNILDLPRLEHSVSDSAMDQLHECGSMAPERIDRVESDIDRRFYEFQNDQSSLEGSAELSVSEYGSSRYDNVDNELLGESHSNSEVILVSVDGHVLTAPISASEQNAENLQLDTPRFNLGPGEETDFCEGNEELGTGESAWAADYISKLEASRTSVAVGNGNICSIQNDKNDIGLQVQVCEGKGERACEAQETEKTSCQGDLQMHTNAEEDASAKAVFSKNCSEVVELAKLAEKTDVEDEGSSLEAQISPEKCHQTLDNGIAELKKNREFSASSGSVLLDNSLSQDLQVEHASAKKAEFFKSSLELVDVAELAENSENANIEDEGSSSKVQISPEKCHQTLDTGVVELEKNNEISDSSRSVLPDNDLSFDLHVGDEPTPEIVSCDSVDSISVHSDLPGNKLSTDLQVGNEPVDEIASFASIDSTSVQSFSNDSERKDEQVGTDSISVHSLSFDLERKEEQMDTDSISGHCVSNVASAAVEGTESSQERPASDGECSKSEPLEPETASPSEVTQVHSSIRFEISLCGNELRAGMGMTAAAEAFDARRISAEEFKTSATSILKNENLIIRCRDRYFSWDKAAPVVLGMAAFGLDLPIETKDAIPVERDDTEKPSTPSGRRWRLWPIPFRRVKTLEHTSSNSSNEEEFVDSESNLLNSQGEETPESPQKKVSPQKQILRTNVPTTEQIASLNLKEGQNVITFSFSTRVLGTQQVDAHIYLWKWNARIVISDVDGTITKSDVLGQFMPLVGKDWTQSGVARLFSAIKENGYQLLFLSARAIIQAYLTRSFLNNLKQDGKALPSGPVVISPDGLFPSLYREVVRRAPHEFKIACLEDIKKLFPEDYNPFYAGFGNRDTDELSYRKIGIPKGKIFIINPKGEVAISHHRAADVKSYTSLHTLVNDMFPPTSLVEQEDFNSWNYWKLPLPEVDI